MAQVIKPKRKFTTGAPTTSDLAEGEIAINTFDKILYIRDDDDNIVHVVCDKCGKGVRVKRKKLEDGKRVRVCRKCGEVIDRV